MSWGPWLQAAAQALVDWYAATYGPVRARRYLGASCQKRGLTLPEVPPRAARSPRWMAIVVALLLIGGIACGLLPRFLAGAVTKVHAESSEGAR